MEGVSPNIVNIYAMAIKIILMVFHSNETIISWLGELQSLVKITNFTERNSLSGNSCALMVVRVHDPIVRAQ
jgi:hypothetical protein